jgi:hypothetical protein
VPFIRQSRDKRGFEYTYVMHTYHPGGNHAQRPRLLYLFRSPASVKLGRTALDAEVMEALEHTHPDLSFDWQVLTRDAAVTRVDNSHDRQPPPQQRRPQPQRNSGSPEAGRPAARTVDQRPPNSRGPATPEPMVALPPDDSVLGRTLGAHEADRLRRRYAELMQRIARRARTPEDRDRLTERLKRLNPEEWADEAAVRANAPGVDAGWNAISGELPSRRRGRRGGRNRPDAGDRPGAIMASAQQSTVEAADEGLETTDTAGPGDDDGGGGPDGAVAADSDQEAPADPDLPIRD